MNCVHREQIVEIFFSLIQFPYFIVRKKEAKKWKKKFAISKLFASCQCHLVQSSVYKGARHYTFKSNLNYAKISRKRFNSNWKIPVGRAYFQQFKWPSTLTYIHNSRFLLFMIRVRFFSQIDKSFSRMLILITRVCQFCIRPCGLCMSTTHCTLSIEHWALRFKR